MITTKQDGNIPAKAKDRIVDYTHRLLREFSATGDGGRAYSFRSDSTLSLFDEPRVFKLIARYSLNYEQDEIETATFIVDQTLTVLKNAANDSPTWPTIHKALTSALGAYNKMQPSLFHVLLPFHVHGDEPSRLRVIRVRDIEFRRISWRAVEHLDSWRSIRKFVDKIEPRHTNLTEMFVPLVASIYTRLPEEANRVVGQRFDTLCGAINLFHFNGRWQMRLTSSPQPIGKLRLPYVYVVYAADWQQHHLYWRPETAEYYTASVVKNWAYTKKLLRMLSSPGTDSTVSEAICSSLSSYQDGLCTLDYGRSFLNFWQGLERLTMSSGVQERRITRNRALRLIGYSDENIDLVEYLESRRNHMVHHGYFPSDGLEEAQMLRVVLERCIIAALGLMRRLPTKHDWAAFYCLPGLRDQYPSLADAIRVVGRLKHLKVT